MTTPMLICEPQEKKKPPIPCALRNRGGGKELEYRMDDETANALTGAETDSLVCAARTAPNCGGGYTADVPQQTVQCGLDGHGLPDVISGGMFQNAGADADTAETEMCVPRCCAELDSTSGRKPMCRQRTEHCLFQPAGHSKCKSI